MKNYLRFCLSDEQTEYFRSLGFVGHNGYSVMKTVPGSDHRLYIQVRNGGWRAISERPFGTYPGWVSDPFPDPISCYINAELNQWQS